MHSIQFRILYLDPMYTLNLNNCFRSRIKKNDRLSSMEDEIKQLKLENKSLKVSIGDLCRFYVQMILAIHYLITRDSGIY